MRNTVETGAALVIGSTLALGGVLAESNRTEAVSPPLPLPIEQLFPECNPSLGLDLGLQVNPINPYDFMGEYNKIHTGFIITDETTGEDRPYTYSDLPHGAYRYVTENPADASANFGFDEDILTELPTSAEFMTEVLGEEYCPTPEIEIFTGSSDQNTTNLPVEKETNK